MDLPNQYLKLEDTLRSAITIMSNAVANRRSLFHTPTLSTIDDNRISTRTMVLREFDQEKRLIRFHTDYRSPKVSNLKKELNEIIA